MRFRGRRAVMSRPLAAVGSPALLSDVADLLERAAAVLGPDADPKLDRLRITLTEPLTLAVAGHTNAGKSTLVNALIGARIAPTADTECTKVITRFRFGSDMAQLVPLRGGPQPLWLTPDRRLPLADELPIPQEQLAHIEVSLSYEPLRRLTVIDTPGLSGDEGLANQTEQLLGLATPNHDAPRLAHDAADVLLFVLGATLRETERGVLRRFRRKTRGRYDFPANALAVLSRADQLSGDDGPWALAQAKASSHAAELAGFVAGVLPVMGKLAETTETGSLTETHAAWLHSVAKATDRDAIVSYPFAFMEADVLDRDAREALLNRLDMFGIRELTRPEDGPMPAATMYDTLRDLSGIAALRERIDILFVRPAAAHKAARVLSELHAIISASTLPDSTCQPLVDRIEAIGLSDPMHALRELKALSALYTGRDALGEPARQQALRLFEHADPAVRLGIEGRVRPDALAQSAAAAAGFWRTIANGAGLLVTRDIAETAARSAQLIRTSLEER
jgi:energy-coupling factor transporter ATP-binding protein EcfA2